MMGLRSWLLEISIELWAAHGFQHLRTVTDPNTWLAIDRRGLAM